MSTPALYPAGSKLQMAALCTRNHPVERAVVLPLFPQLSRPGGDDAGTGGGGGPFDDQPVGFEVRPRVGQTHSTPLEPTNDSWRVDETYIKIKSVWKYLYRAVDSAGNTLDFMLSAKRDGKAAIRFFRKVLKASTLRLPA